MKDFHDNMTVRNVITPAVAGADVTSAVVDKRGFEGLVFVLSVGIGGITFTTSNKIEIVVQHSDEAGSGFVAVDPKDILGAPVAAGGIVKAFVAAHAAANVYRFGYKGAKRYVRVIADFSGTHGTGTPMAATAILFNGHVQPQPDQI